MKRPLAWNKDYIAYSVMPEPGGGAGGHCLPPPPIFGGSVIPIPIIGGRFCPPFTTGTPIFFTFRHHCY